MVGNVEKVIIYYKLNNKLNYEIVEKSFLEIALENLKTSGFKIVDIVGC